MTIVGKITTKTNFEKIVIITSKEDKTAELKDKDLEKINGGGLYEIPATGWYTMYTSSMMQINSTGYRAFKRKDSNESFYVCSVCDNYSEGSNAPYSTTYCFKSLDSYAFFSFIAEKNGTNICYDLE